MDRANRLNAVRQAMALAQSYKAVIMAGGEVSPEVRALCVIAEEYEQCSELVLNQAQTIEQMMVEQGTQTSILSVSTNNSQPVENPEQSAEAPTAQLFDVVSEGTGITIKRSE